MKLSPSIASFALCLALPLTGCAPAAYVPSPWLSRVPAASRTEQNPLPPSSAAVGKGAEQYSLYCAECHGRDGAGNRARPSLRNGRVRAETDGEIHWILVNGSKGHGMPAWRSLGDDSLWQLVLAIRAMPPEGK